MIESLNMEFSADGTRCVGFSSDKENNFYKDISLIFQNITDIPISYTITLKQLTENDFIDLSKTKHDNEVKNLTSTTKKSINYFFKTFQFKLKPYTQTKILIRPSYEKNDELLNNLILTNYKITLTITNKFQVYEYNLNCFKNLEANHNPYEPIASESDLNSKALPPRPTPQRERLKRLTNNTLTDENETPKPQKKEKPIIFVKSKPGLTGVKRTTPSPEAPKGSIKSYFSVLSFKNPIQAPSVKPLPQTPDVSTIVESQGPLPKPTPGRRPRTELSSHDLSPPPGPKKRKEEVNDPYLNKILN